MEAALRTAEFANSSTPLGQADWVALARSAHNWWTGGQTGGLVSVHLYGVPHRDPRMRKMVICKTTPDRVEDVNNEGASRVLGNTSYAT